MCFLTTPGILKPTVRFRVPHRVILRYRAQEFHGHGTKNHHALPRQLCQRCAFYRRHHQPYFYIFFASKQKTFKTSLSHNFTRTVPWVCFSFVFLDVGLLD